MPPIELPVESVEVSAYTIPTDQPEQDGTLDWDSTTLVLVEVRGGGEVGVGYTYADVASADVVRSKLSSLVCGEDAMQVRAAWTRMWHATRNLGYGGVVASAISAVAVALWDLKARVLGVPLVTAIDAAHETCPIYGSGGFTNYSMQTLADQLSGWAEQGIPRVKMKVGRDPGADAERARVAREAIGDATELFVDANGALTQKQALDWAWRFRDDFGVSWFEEPVSSDDLEGLHLLVERGPGGLDIAAGEYGYTPWYFREMLRARAVDCLQADVTRCGGITGFLDVGAVCTAYEIDLSAHCAPAISAQAGCGVWRLRHLEYFHDHVRIEHLAFDGVLTPEKGGVLRPDRSRPGHGLTVRHADLERYRVA